MGRSGLWPGRRWRGLTGAGTAMRAMEDLQLDPLVVVARAHDLMLHSRVIDYAIDDWATLTYERREFFEWGGWLAVRPMEELPYFRVLMRREREQAPLGRGRTRARTMRSRRCAPSSRERGEVSNRDFAMRDRTRIDNYRGRKDSALALHYLWRVGEAMVTRRDRFERVYALTEAVAPAAALREVDEAEADDVLRARRSRPTGLTRLNGVNSRTLRAQGERRRADGLARSPAGGRHPRRGPGRGLAGDPGRARDGRGDPRATSRPAACPATGRRSRRRPTRRRRSSRRSIRSARAVARSRCSASTTSGRSTSRSTKRSFGYYTMPILWGDRLVGRFDPKLDRTTGTLVILGLWLEDDALARDAAFATRSAAG